MAFCVKQSEPVLYPNSVENWIFAVGGSVQQSTVQIQPLAVVFLHLRPPYETVVLKLPAHIILSRCRHSKV